MKSDLYPLRFQPIFQQYLWGGRRLESVLGKTLGPGETYAESWEVVDHGEDQSIVAAGPLAGKSLAELVAERGEALFGRHHPQRQFPLLFKFLDAHRHLSVQVHPDDARAARQDPPDLGKTEAWVILAAEPGSQMWAGLKRGFDRAALVREVSRGTTELCLHKIEPAVGDCIFIPAGTVHALGAGLVVAEIQQASNTTFRVYDWNRVGADGQSRELHVEEALDCIDYDKGPIAPQIPEPTGDPQVEQLVACDKFVLNRWRFDGTKQLPNDNVCRILAVLSGALSVAGDPTVEPVQSGHSLLIPAACSAAEISAIGPVELLEMRLP